MMYEREKTRISLLEDQDLSPRGKEVLEKYIKALPVPKKLELAIKGNKEVRMILAKDGNKLVARAVVRSPKISEEEIVTFAQSPTVNEEVLRIISEDHKMTANRRILTALCNNPRTPVGTVIKFLPRLDIRELKGLANNKNVSAAVSAQAKRIVLQKMR